VRLAIALFVSVIAASAQDTVKPYLSAIRPHALMLTTTPAQSAEVARKAIASVMTTLNIPVTFIDNPALLDAKALAQFDVFVAFGAMHFTPEQEQALWTFTENGGGILALHDAADGPANGAWEKLIGGRLVRQPGPYPVWIHLTDAGRKTPLLAGVRDFEVTGEVQNVVSYNLDPPPGRTTRASSWWTGSRHVIIHGYAMDNTSDAERASLGNNGVMNVIAGQWNEVGKGRVVYLSPGYTAPVMNHPEMQRLYENSLRWLLPKVDW
jgi:type 1 glutamine amidotransferase